MVSPFYLHDMTSHVFTLFVMKPCVYGLGFLRSNSPQQEMTVLNNTLLARSEQNRVHKTSKTKNTKKHSNQKETGRE